MTTEIRYSKFSETLYGTIIEGTQYQIELYPHGWEVSALDGYNISADTIYKTFVTVLVADDLTTAKKDFAEWLAKQSAPVVIEPTEPTPTPGIIATIESSLEVVTDESEREQLYADLIAAWEDLQCEIEMEAQARTERNTHRETLMVVPDMEVTKRVILAEPESRPLKSRTPHDLIYGVWHSMQATQDLFHITMQFRAYCKAHGMDYDTLRDELVYEASVGNPKGYTRKVQNLTEAETVTLVREIEKRMVETHER